jgi:hypothetical protein
MKKRSPLRLATLAIFFCSMYWRPSFSQIKVSEERHGAQWTDWIKRYPPSKNAKELELIFSFPDAKLLERDIYFGSQRMSKGTERAIFMFWIQNGELFLSLTPKEPLLRRWGEWGKDRENS